MNFDTASNLSAERPKTIGAIDIGSNSIRLVIAQILPDEQVEVLERLQQAVKLGQDTFTSGRISRAAMAAAISILRDYKKILELYDVGKITAVATSAVREAGNSDTFLDRVYMTTGLDVIILGTAQESRLTVSAVHESLKSRAELKNKKVIIVHVGGGGTLLTLWKKGEILASQSLPLGAVRLQEALSVSSESPAAADEIIRNQISAAMSTAMAPFDLKDIHTFVGVGGDARFAADQVGSKVANTDLKVIDGKDFNKLVKHCQKLTNTQLSQEYGLPFEDVETLKPALALHQALMKQTKAKSMIVSYASMRDGLILELTKTALGKEDEVLSKGVIHAAMALADKYDVDMKHALYVAGLSARLFDELQSRHGLSGRYCLLLQIATILHEVGGFISNRAHHKHSYYIIINSEVFGLSPNDITMVAHVARYHRKSRPKTSHIEYMSLPRETRLVINKLAAILRVAEALDANRTQMIEDFKCEIDNEIFNIIVENPTELNLERMAMTSQSDMFEDIFGMKVNLQ